ncbi:type II toxin-antitoxin system RelE/ParE family toxin [Synechococcus sp. PCC 7336]|uniref:type II toxin-antitoxin system RelE family toxin n=1 Tax=Synechococcus sp. PCC 7336 TaxID=195250 RepID=UPI00037A19C4|nr:type II toxin-antitoxin system RelE/ParE family toxin [Synechococcus sp. PCC 7336]
MANFKVIFKQSVAKDLRRIPNKDIARILNRIEGLAVEPRPPGVEKLSAQERYRIRQGVYRIVYEIVDEEAIVAIVKIGHRRDVYRSK